MDMHRASKLRTDSSDMRWRRAQEVRDKADKNRASADSKNLFLAAFGVAAPPDRTIAPEKSGGSRHVPGIRPGDAMADLLHHKPDNGRRWKMPDRQSLLLPKTAKADILARGKLQHAAFWGAGERQKRSTFSQHLKQGQADPGRMDNPDRAQVGASVARGIRGKPHTAQSRPPSNFTPGIEASLVSNPNRAAVATIAIPRHQSSPLKRGENEPIKSGDTIEGMKWHGAVPRHDSKPPVGMSTRVLANAKRDDGGGVGRPSTLRLRRAKPIPHPRTRRAHAIEQKRDRTLNADGNGSDDASKRLTSVVSASTPGFPDGALAHARHVDPASLGARGQIGPAGLEQARLVSAQIMRAVSDSPGQLTEISLDPASLGRVRMKLHTHDSGITLHISAENPDVSNLLKQHLDSLSADLKDLGFTDIGFSFSGSDQRGAENQERRVWSDGGSSRASIPDTLPDIRPETRLNRPQPLISDGLDLRL